MPEVLDDPVVVTVYGEPGGIKVHSSWKVLKESGIVEPLGFVPQWQGVTFRRLEGTLTVTFKSVVD